MYFTMFYVCLCLNNSGHCGIKNPIWIIYELFWNYIRIKIWFICYLGKTYFFKGKGFWKFNDLRMRVENEQQTLSAPFWMGCPRPLEGPNTRTKEKFVSEPVSSGLLSQTPPSVFIFAVVLAFSCRLWTFIT